MTQKNDVSDGPSGEPRRADPNADLGHEMKHLAGEAAGQARKLAEGRIAGRRERAAEGLGRVANALRDTGQRLESQDTPELGQYIGQAAHKLEQVAAYVKERDLREVVRDVEGFARREPALFFGGAFALGLLGSRFLKSSSSGAGPRSSADLPALPSGAPRERPNTETPWTPPRREAARREPIPGARSAPRPERTTLPGPTGAGAGNPTGAAPEPVPGARANGPHAGSQGRGRSEGEPR